MDTFVTTPSSSDVDMLIEKFRLEIGNQVDNDDDDTRKLTITSTVKPKDSNTSSHDIDRQISDLEDLIKKLQDEITEMSKNADREVDYTPLIVDDSCDLHKDLSNETIILNDDTEDTETLRNRMKREDTRTNLFDNEPFNHIFPLMIRDVILPLDSGFTILRAPTDRSYNDSDSKQETLSIKQDVIDIWNDLPTPEDNLEGLICELQAEITEKMETLKDVITEESCNNPDTKFEDA